MKTPSKIHFNINQRHPLAGDVVYIASSNDKDIKNGTIGVIEGKIGQIKDELTVCFDPEFPVTITNDQVISKKGIRLLIESDKMFFSENKKEIKNLFEKHQGERQQRRQNDLVLVKRMLTTI